MDSGKIDYTLVTSSATAAGVVRLFGKSLCRTTLVSISPLTGTALKEAGYPAAFQAAEATVEFEVRGMSILVTRIQPFSISARAMVIS